MSQPTPAANPPVNPADRTIAEAGQLPPYTRSLLRIRVPVVVTLAAKTQSLGEVLELAPGAIIHFDKSCEEMLDMEVGGRRVATGETVKIGDKFGLRIDAVVLPDERFHTVRPTSAD